MKKQSRNIKSMTGVYTKERLKAVVRRFLGDKTYNSVLKHLKSDPPNLWGMHQPDDYLEVSFCIVVVKYRESIGYGRMEEALDWPGRPSHQSLAVNSQRILPKLREWADARMPDWLPDQLFDLAANAHFDHHTFPAGCLWIDSTDFKLANARCYPADEYFSWKENHYAQRYMAVSAANMQLVHVEGGYSPKVYDGHMFTRMRKRLESKYEGCGFFADEHFTAAGRMPKKLKVYSPFSNKGRPRKGHSKRPALTGHKKWWNGKVQQARKVVESPFGIIKKTWKSLNEPFQEDWTLQDHLIKFAIVVYNRSV
jgi:hypothetical protein